jgi:hypothetical protein
MINTPAAFQGYVNWVLRNCFDIYCIAYLDDSVIYSGTLEEHN